MTKIQGTFTTLRAALAPLEWSEIVGIVSEHARSQGMRWDDAARQLADAATEDVTRAPGQA